MEGRELFVYLLTIASSSTRNPTRCEDCEFNAESESDLKIHMREKHEIECNTCNEKFAGLRKLKNHMCRIHVVNPSSGDYYMKNWYLNNDCISVFSKQQQREVALIHSIYCVEKQHCSYFPTSLKSVVENETCNVILDLPATIYMTDNNVNWEEVEDRLDSYFN